MYIYLTDLTDLPMTHFERLPLVSIKRNFRSLSLSLSLSRFLCDVGARSLLR